MMVAKSKGGKKHFQFQILPERFSQSGSNESVIHDIKNGDIQTHTHTHTPPLIPDCWQTRALHGITHHCWISHSQYSLNANTHIGPHAMGLTLPLKWKRVDPMLSDPNLPQLPLPTATSLCSLASSFQWPPSTYLLTQHVAWETLPWTLSRRQKHILDQNFASKFWDTLRHAMQRWPLSVVSFVQGLIFKVHDTYTSSLFFSAPPS